MIGFCLLVLLRGDGDRWEAIKGDRMPLINGRPKVGLRDLDVKMTTYFYYDYCYVGSEYGFHLYR